MNSVASKRLFQEYKHLTTDPPEGITAGPVNEDDLFLWEAMIQGPEGTPYEGGVFPAELKFPKDYPLMPPTMKFQCDIWHPNGKNRKSGKTAGTARLTQCSLRERRCVYLNPPPSRGRPEPLRAGFRAVEPDPKRGKDLDQCDEHDR